MKYLLICSTLILTLVFCGNSQASLKISVENESDVNIDSLVFFIQNFQVTIPEIAGRKTKSLIVNADTIQRNNHDVIIHITAHAKGKNKFTGGFDYNDLSGTLPLAVKIKISKDLKILIFSYH